MKMIAIFIQRRKNKLIFLLISFTFFSLSFSQNDERVSAFFISCLNDSFPDSVFFEKKINYTFLHSEILRQIKEENVFYQFKRYESKEIRFYCKAKLISSYDTIGFKKINESFCTTSENYENRFSIEMKEIVNNVNDSIESNDSLFRNIELKLAALEKQWQESWVTNKFDVYVSYMFTDSKKRNRAKIILQCQGNMVLLKFRIGMRNRRFLNNYPDEKICFLALNYFFRDLSREILSNGRIYMYGLGIEYDE